MVFTFAGTIASFIDEDWQLIERMVIFYHIQDKDTKGVGSKAFVKTAAERGGLDSSIHAHCFPSQSLTTF